MERISFNKPETRMNFQKMDLAGKKRGSLDHPGFLSHPSNFSELNLEVSQQFSNQTIFNFSKDCQKNLKNDKSLSKTYKKM